MQAENRKFVLPYLKCFLCRHYYHHVSPRSQIRSLWLCTPESNLLAVCSLELLLLDLLSLLVYAIPATLEFKYHVEARWGLVCSYISRNMKNRVHVSVTVEHMIL